MCQYCVVLSLECNYVNEYGVQMYMIYSMIWRKMYVSIYTLISGSCRKRYHSAITRFGMFFSSSQIQELGMYIAGFVWKLGTLKLDHPFSSSNAVVSRVVCPFSDHMISQEEKSSIARMIWNGPPTYSKSPTKDSIRWSMYDKKKRSIRIHPFYPQSKRL